MQSRGVPTAWVSRNTVFNHQRQPLTKHRKDPAVLTFWLENSDSCDSVVWIEVAVRQCACDTVGVPGTCSADVDRDRRISRER